jgi:hypothetical protein
MVIDNIDYSNKIYRRNTIGASDNRARLREFILKEKGPIMSLFE